MRPSTAVVLIASFWKTVTATVSNVPTLNGPIPYVGNVQFGKSRVGDFIHPGLWHTHDDLERIRTNALSGVEPWSSAYAKFSNDSFSQSSYVMKGPYQVLSRGAISNYTAFTDDVRAAWQNSLMWYITKQQSHWDRSTTILDAWGTNLTNIIGTDTSLLVGLEGSLFANAAEIMRWEGNWTEAGAHWYGGSGFSNQLYWLFARQSIIIGQANYGMISIKALLDFAVYLDDVSMYNYALNAFINDPCAGIYGNIEPSTGQSAESGRDQGHATSGLAWTALAARTVQSQGGDLYGLGDNLLLKGYEYAAQYNLFKDVPYDPKFYRCEAILINGPWSEISNITRGVGIVPSTGSKSESIWDIAYYQYAIKRGINAPWTTKAKQAYDAAGGEVNPGSGNTDDQPSWGDLVWAYDAPGLYINDNSRTIWGGGTLGPNGLGNINSQ